ncbi:MAG: Asp-tRNA(Asn)/Glu-tRNA(Gln) amidotransferase subunit GatC [Actinomycetota bacterium]
MAVSRDEVIYIAELARIALPDDEIPFLQEELSSILAEVQKMQQLDTDNVIPTSHVIPRSNVFREDVVTDGLAADAVLQMAPQHERSFSRVPSILGMGNDGIAD